MAAASNNVIEEKKDQSVPMAPTMNIDFAAQIQNALSAQFMASLSSPAWLNSLSRQQGAGMGVTPPNTPQEPERRQRTAPHGGIKTGEIGANGKPSVKCPDCGKVLADPSSLYRHRKIHTGEKPHTCPFCRKDFIQRYNMKQHIKTHRNIAQELIDAAMRDPGTRNSRGASAQGPDAGPNGDGPPAQGPNGQGPEGPNG